MTWAHAWILGLLPALAALAALRWWWGVRVRRAQAGLGAAPSVGVKRSRLRAACLWLGLALGIIAAAGPRWGARDETRSASGADVLVLLDCSRSMLATDLAPNRLESARRKLLDLLHAAPDTRLALMPFAAIPALRCPPTGDREVLDALLRDCSPELFPAASGFQGTAIGEGLAAGLEVLGRQVERGQAILVVSDGADEDQPAVEKATQLAKAAGVPVFGWFFGDPEREVKLAIDGREEVMKASRETLDQLAQATGGVSVNATTDDADVRAIAAHLGSDIAPRPWEERRRIVASERYHWFLLPAIGLLALGALLPTRRGRTVLLLLLAAGLAQAADPWEALATAGRLPPAEARSAVEKLLGERPDFLAARYALGTLLLDAEPERAIEPLRAAAAAPDDQLAADSLHNLALVFARLGRWEEALTTAAEAAKRDPTAVGLRDEIRRIALARADEARRKAEEEAKKLKLPDAQLADAHVAEGYDARIAARGGTAPYRFAPAGECKLPEGLALDADGRLHGTPLKPGAHSLQLQVQDGAKATAIGTIRIEVLPRPAITTEALPEAIVGQPYQAPLACQGLRKPQWSATGLPAGLRLDGAAITGTATALGTATVELTVVDGAHRAIRRLPLLVSDGFAPAESELPPATAWAAYSHKTSVRGPAQAYRWQAATQGGLKLAEDGGVSGTPEQAGRVELATGISAADGRSRQATLAVPVNPPPLIEETAEIALTAGSPTTRPLKRSGGTAPFTWRVAEGALPTGLRLDEDGSLRGVASEPGKAEVTVELSDRWQASTRQKLQLVVNENPEKPQGQKDDQQKQDQQDDQKKQDQQKQDQPQDQQKQDQQTAQGQKSDADQKKEDAQQQAEALGAAAAQRWLDRLPEQDKDALRYQLLDGGQGKPQQHGNPW